MSESTSDSDDTPDERQHHADRLKERIYLTFAALAVVLTLSAHSGVEAGEALQTLAVTILGTLLAVFTADLVSHIVVHGRMPSRLEFRRVVGASFGTLGAVLLPFVFLLVALLGHWSVGGALRASAFTLIATLIVIGYAAARRIPLSPLQRLFVLGAEAVLGLAVIGLQVLAHG